MAIVKRFWGGLFVILMALTRPLISWLLESRPHAEAQSPTEAAYTPDDHETVDSERATDQRRQGVLQAPPRVPFQPMRQPAWKFWEEGDADAVTWGVLENQRIRSRQTAALLILG